MLTGSVAAVMVHVPSVSEGLAWYERAFPSAKRAFVSNPDFEFLSLGDIRIEVVAADDKVATGAAGSVVYWLVHDFEATLTHLLQLGAVIYRGPLNIEGGQRMCQVRDPWGNCLGLRG